MAKKTSTTKQRTRIILQAFDHTILDKAVEVILQTAQRTGAIVAGPIPLPTRIRRITVNKSTFVSKNSREQFEMRIHKRLLDLHETTAATIEGLTNISLPSGVDIEIKVL